MTGHNDSKLRSVNFASNPKCTSLSIRLNLKNRTVPALLDSGAEVTVLKSSIAESLGINCSKFEKVSLNNAQEGSSMIAYFCPNLSFKIGVKSYSWPVFIAPIKVPFILGFDFAHYHGAVLDYGTPQLLLHNEKLPAVVNVPTGDFEVCRVKINSKVTLPPMSVSEIPVQLRGSNPDKGYVIEQVMSNRKVVFAATCVKGGDVSTARVFNFENRKVTLGKKKVVAMAVEVEETPQPSEPVGTSVKRITLKEEVDMINKRYRTARQQRALNRINKASNTTHNLRNDDDCPELPAHLKQLYLDSIKNLNRSEQVKLAKLLVAYQDVFSKDDQDLGHNDQIQHRIDTGNHPPIRQPMRRTPHGLEKVEDDIIDKMYKSGVIEESNSEWASPVVIVKKKDGSHRFCVDYRKLNAVTSRDSYPLPNIDHCLTALGGAKYFHTLDLNSGYWQVSVHPDDREKTAFICRRGLFQYRSMPFGLSCAPMTFERLMESVLRGLQWEWILCFLDDVIVMAATVDEALHRLAVTLERFRKANLKLKPRKCRLMQTETLFLGFVVDSEGVRVNPELVKDILNWPRPENVGHVQSFLGTTSYFRKWIPGYAELASPLYSLTQKKVKFKWEESQEEAFQALKQKLVNPPILAHPIPGGRFILDCDASSNAVGFCLLQEQPDGEGNMVERVIAYNSAHLHRSQKNYCATRLELLALVKGCRTYRHFLLCQPFLCRTDHSSLTWLLNFKNAEGQLARFLEELSSYNMIVQHRSGRLHTVPDGLSRRPPDDTYCECYQAGMSLESLPCGGCGYCSRAFQNWESFHEDVDYVVPLTAPNIPNVGTVGSTYVGADPEGMPFWSGAYTSEEMRERQLRDPDLCRVFHFLDKGEPPRREDLFTESRAVKSYILNWSQLIVKDGVLYLEWIDKVDQTRLKLLVPRDLRSEVMAGCHDSRLAGHMGEIKTVQMVRDRFHWFELNKDVILYVKCCDVCQRSKRANRKARAPLMKYQAGFFNEKLHLDILGPFHKSESGSKYVLLMVDNFTKYIEACALPDQTAELIARKFVNDWVAKFGVPVLLMSDQGSNFCSSLMSEVCRLLECAKMRTTPYHPSSNSQVERYCGMITRMIRSFTDRAQRT